MNRKIIDTLVRRALDEIKGFVAADFPDLDFTIEAWPSMDTDEDSLRLWAHEYRGVEMLSQIEVPLVGRPLRVLVYDEACTVVARYQIEDISQAAKTYSECLRRDVAFIEENWSERDAGDPS